MKKSKSRFRRLQARIRDWNVLMNAKNLDQAVEGRVKTGGYKCPGSLKR